MGKQRSSSTGFSSLRSGSLSVPGGGWVEDDCNRQRGWCSFKAWFQLQNSCQLSQLCHVLGAGWLVPLLQNKANAMQLGASRPGKWQCLSRAYGAHAIPAMVLLYARGTADWGLFWQVSAVRELYFLWLSVLTFSLSLPMRGHLHQRVCKSVCE